MCLIETRHDVTWKGINITRSLRKYNEDRLPHACRIFQTEKKVSKHQNFITHHYHHQNSHRPNNNHHVSPRPNLPRPTQTPPATRRSRRSRQPHLPPHRTPSPLHCPTQFLRRLIPSSPPPLAPTSRHHPKHLLRPFATTTFTIDLAGDYKRWEAHPEEE